MLSARPIESFRLGRKLVVVCQVADENPYEFLGKEFFVYSEGRRVGRITIDGVSTASPIANGICDFSYSGEEIRSDLLGEATLITEVRYAGAIEEIDVI
jgi:hypothetical protein